MPDPQAPDVRVLGVAYPSIYVRDVARAVAFYERVLGPVAFREEGAVGIRLGDTWLTLLDADAARMPADGPRNAEVHLRLASAADVDEMFRRFVGAGSKAVMAPRDTWMYEPLRYALVEDPQGLRVGLIHPRPTA